MLRLALIFFVFVAGCKYSAQPIPAAAKPAAPDSTVTVRYDTLFCGDTPIQFITCQKKRSGVLMINLHEDEVSSIEAAQRYTSDSGGTFIRLHQKATRTIDFFTAGKQYTFDPNRIFTPLGRKNTLLKFGGTSPEAEISLGRFADTLRSIITRDSLPILAMHNNTPDNYSALSYLAEYKNDADSVAIAKDGDPDDFFFLIAADAYTYLKAKNYSVVLQNNTAVTDDGSLSVFCGSAGIPYINIEAEQGHVEAQYTMLQTAVEFFNSKSKKPGK